MEKTRYLTKSRFKLAMECPTKLFYTGKDDLYRNSMTEDSFMESLAEGGFQVGKMATMLFPAGIEITEKSNASAIKRTKELIASADEVTLFEPAFEFDGLLVRVDVFVKRGYVIELYEVKAKSYDSNNPSFVGSRGAIRAEMRPYLEDIAFQKYVVSKAFSGCSVMSYLIMPDKAVNATVTGLNQCFKITREGRSTVTVVSDDAEQKVQQSTSLLAKVNVDTYVDMVMGEPLPYPGSTRDEDDLLPNIVKRWAYEYAKDQKILTEVHSGCAKCQFRASAGDSLKSGYHECLRDRLGLADEEIDGGTVLDIWRLRKEKLLAQGVYRLSQVQDGDIKVKDDKDGLSFSRRQWMQVRGIDKDVDRGGYYFDSNYFLRQMQKWSYPFHMIDFETSTVALPFFEGMRPYESVAFQFSHHIVYADGRIEHKNQALFVEPGEFPNFKFVRALKDAVGTDNGTIFRWAAHENTILRHIRGQLESQPDTLDDKQELIAFIDGITDSGARTMVDLNEVAIRSYFHPDTKGSTSIKKVLPSVLKVSDYLRNKYSNPIYGNDIPSLNFTEPFCWCEEKGGAVRDPYDRLKGSALSMLEQGESEAQQTEGLVEIAEGGAAAMAYAKLQFESLSTERRDQIKTALLRYCELDTFAMVMIFEAWAQWSD
jgi:hypothetical protein